MKKWKGKQRLLMTCIVFCLTGLCNMIGLPFMPASVVEAAEEVDSGSCGAVTWTLDSEGTFTISGNGAMLDYDEYDDRPWCYDSQYRACDEIVNVVIEEGVTHIGSYSFARCYNVKSITLPSTVVSIGEGAFSRCEGLVSVEFSENLTSIGCFSFAFCDSLKSVSVPEGVTVIASQTFHRCDALTSVSLPDSVTTIEFGAFNSGSLTSINIPRNCTIIEDHAFSSSAKWTSVTVDDNNPIFCEKDGVVYNKEMTKLLLYPAGKTDSVFAIPYGVTSVGNICGDFGGFHNDTVTEVIIPETVTTIEPMAFSGCSNLTSVKMTEGLTTIERYAFTDCNINSIVLPSSVQSIGKGAFQYNANLTSITILGMNTKIGEYNWGEPVMPVFEGCPNVTIQCYKNSSAYVYAITNSIPYTWLVCDFSAVEVSLSSEIYAYTGGGVNPILTVTLNGMPLEYGIDYTVSLANNVNFGTATVTVTGIGAFSGTKTLNFEIVPQYMTTAIAGKYKYQFMSDAEVAFAGINSSKTKEVTIPATVNIGGRKFKVTSIVPMSLKNSKVTKVTIGKNVKIIGSSAFYGCSKLKSVTIGKNVTTIEDKAFYKCKVLTKLTIPSKVTKLGKQAFYNCSKLKSITIKTTKLKSKNVGKNAFKGIYSKATIKLPKKQYKSYVKLLKAKGAGKKVKYKKF